MGENPLQQLEPVEVSFQELAKGHFPGFTRANLIGTAEIGGLISGGIMASQAAILGREADVSHTMRYLGRGLVIDQQETLQLRSLKDYRGCMVRSYCWPGYTLDQRDSLCVESLIQLQDYAWLVIAAHAVEAALGLDDLAERVASDDAADCSQGAYKIELLEQPGFMGGPGRVPMPEEIDQWCIDAGWEIRTWLLVD